MWRNFLIIFFLIFLTVGWAASATPKTKLLLVSFDGFRWDYADRRPDLTSFQYLEKNGVRADYIIPAFPTQTSPNHMSIATGQYVESHGVVHNCDYTIGDDPALKTFYTALKNNEWWDNGAEPIWITAVNQGLKSGGILWPGSNSTYSEVAPTASVLDEQDTPKDEEAWRGYVDLAMEWFTQDDFSMVALYFNEPDKTGHRNGPDDPSIKDEMMPLLDRTINYLIDQIKRHQLTDVLDVIITSDHGFDTIDTSITRTDPNAISLTKYVNQSYVDWQFAYGPLGLVQAVPGQEEYVAQQLRNGNANMEVFTKDEIPERWHFTNNDRITNVLVSSKPGFSVYQYFTGFHPNTGEHGFDNKYENMRATYYSIGPSFKKGYRMSGFENVHIYPLMCHLLGLNPHPNNGSFQVLEQTLLDGDSDVGGAAVTSSSTSSVVVATLSFLLVLFATESC